MKRILNKIITSLLILMLLLVSCPMAIIKSNAEEIEKVEYENVADYILKTEDSTSCQWGAVIIENAIIKDFSDISNYTAASFISMENVDIGNVDGVEIPMSVERITIFGKFSGTLSLTNNTNLEYLVFSEREEGDLANAVIDIRGLEKIYTFCFEYIGDTKYLMNEKVLMDDYSILIDEYDFTIDNITTNVFHFNIYDNVSDYYEKELVWEYDNKEDVTSIWFGQGITIKDMSDISEFLNLEELSIYRAVLGDGSYSFENNKKLKDIHINFAQQDLENIVVDIRNMDWLKEFYIDSDYIDSGFELEKNLLMDNHDILGGGDNSEGFSYYYWIFDTVEECLQNSGDSKEEVTEFWISGKGTIIKNLDGLKELTNLKSLYIENMNIENADFIKDLTWLEKIEIDRCTLNNTIDLKNYTNLKDIKINLYGDFSNSCIDIMGLKNLEDFNYVYDIQNSTNFDLSRCIKTDVDLRNENYETFVRYYWNNNGEYYLNYSMINDWETEEGIQLLFGFNLNNGKITANEIINGNYFLDGIDVKIYNSNDELLTGDSIVGSGCKVKLFINNEFKKEYNIVIFGDVTGDGIIAASDALAIIRNKNKKVLINNPVLEAAGSVTYNSYIEDTPSAVEALAIIKYLNGKYDIEQYFRLVWRSWIRLI